MKILDKKTSSDLVKLLIFILVTSLASAVLVILIGNLTFKSSTDYKAVFTDVTGVNKGDDVRIAGVRVGTVKSIDILDRTVDDDGNEKQPARAVVTFAVEDGTTLQKSTQAIIKYRNLVGQRYISLTEGIGDTADLEEGDEIPIGQTKPALDLTLLFNGFKPLFQALTPSDVNTLSYEVIQVFQGEGGTLEGLLRSTASVTQTLADRDEVIGQLIDNLDYVLDHIADRDTQLTALIKSFRNLVSGLKDDRFAILDSLEGISDLTDRTASLAQGIRPPFVEDIKQLRRLAGVLDRNKAELDRALQVLPIKLEKIGRTASYGSWFNFYLCDFKGVVRVPGLPAVNVGAQNLGGERCDLG